MDFRTKSFPKDYGEERPAGAGGQHEVLGVRPTAPGHR